MLKVILQIIEGFYGWCHVHSTLLWRHCQGRPKEGVVKLPIKTEVCQKVLYVNGGQKNPALAPFMRIQAAIQIADLSKTEGRASKLSLGGSNLKHIRWQSEIPLLLY